MNRRTTVGAAVILAAALTASPALAKSKPKPKPLKGTWSFTDTTPDPSGDASTDDTTHCQGRLPAGPADVNTATLKVTRPGTLTVNGSATGDWAMEVRDAKGNTLTGNDENPPAQESVSVDLTKGAWTVVYCNLSGAPTASAAYTFVFR